MLNGHGNCVLEKWMVEMEIGNGNGSGNGNGKEKKIKRDVQTKDGKVNEKSKWKNGKIMVKGTEVKDEKSR